MIDTDVSGSPGWWLANLYPKLQEQADHHDSMCAYRDGTNAIPAVASKAIRDSYRRLMAMSRTNFAELAVEATRERMQPIGFRTGTTGDAFSDQDAQRIWQANSLDADFAQVLRSKGTGGVSYMMTGPVDPETGVATITPESPRCVITEQHPVRRRRSIAALKFLTNPSQGFDLAYVFLPGWVFRARRTYTPTLDTHQSLGLDGFEWIDRGQQLPPLLANAVPIVKFGNNEDDTGRSWGEFERHLSILDRISYTILQRVEVATMQAFRQRGLKGDMPNVDPETGEPVDWDDIFSADPGALWRLPAGVDVWESGQVDLGPIRQAIRDDIQDFAAGTRTPLFYVAPDSANGSAEGASLAREGLIFKARDRIPEASEPLEIVMAQAFAWAGDEVRAKAVDMEVLWASPEHLTLTEKSMAAVQYQAAGVTWEEVMSKVLGFTPAEITRMSADRNADRLLTLPAT